MPFHYIHIDMFVEIRDGVLLLALVDTCLGVLRILIKER